MKKTKKSTSKNTIQIGTKYYRFKGDDENGFYTYKELKKLMHDGGISDNTPVFEYTLTGKKKVHFTESLVNA